MNATSLSKLVSDLRREGNDFPNVEVKRAHRELPHNVATTLSAFANTPGGGTLIFGLDESQHFVPVGVADPAKLKSALASCARQAVEPPVTFDTKTLQLENVPIVVATIHELPSTAKPCRVRSTRRAYLRAYDGDFSLSSAEEQAFLANREVPRFDQTPVTEAQLDDLDPALVNDYIGQCRIGSTSLARFTDAEILHRTGVTIGSEPIPSTAGLLSLGRYPQQFFPNLVIQASMTPGQNDQSGIRATDTHKFDGPIPSMLDDALRWVMRNSRTRLRAGSDGHLYDEPEYPAEAVRELLSNALVHRDLGQYALTQPITLKITPQHVTLSNPGGLWGLTVERLGKVGVTSARNGWLLRICQNVRFGSEQRVVEALATGIPTVMATTAAAGNAPPRFYDQGIRFTVHLPSAAVATDQPPSAVPPARDKSSNRERNAKLILTALQERPATLAEIAQQTSLTERQTRYALELLGEQRRVRLRGGKGKKSLYEVSTNQQGLLS